MRLRTFAALFGMAITVCVGFFFAADPAWSDNVTASGTVGGGSTITLSGVNINNNAASITLTPNTTTNVFVNATILDNNGCSVVTPGTTTVMLYRSGITSSSCLVAQNPLDCYLTHTFTASSTCSGGTTNTTTTFAVQYYAQATDSSSSFYGQNWMATVLFTDATSSPATSTADSTSVTSTADIATMVALNIPTSTINYGLLTPSSTTSSTNQLVNIENAGNASDTIAVNGTAFISGSNTIATSSQHYATSSFTYGTGDAALTDTATTITGILTAPVFNFPIGGAGWQQTTALPNTNKSHSSVAYNGYLYSTGGVVGGALTSTVLFAPINATGSLGAWTNTQALPYGVDFHVSLAYNGYIYTIGGSILGGVTSTVLFAPINATGSLGAWTNTQALPFIAQEHSSVAFNGYLYMIGGCQITCATSTVLFAPINATGSLGAWTSTQSLPFPDREQTSVAYNGYLYTIGGFDNGGINGTSTVLFAPINATGSLGAWTSTQALPYGVGFHTSIVYNGYLYTIGGEASSTDTSTVLFAPINATGSLGAWTSTQALPYKDKRHKSVVYNGYLYTIGGAGNGVDTSTVLFAPLNARSTYWGMSVPGSVPAGAYTDTVTFTASYSP